MTKQVLFAVTILILITSFAIAQKIQFVSAPNVPPDSAKEMYTAYCASCHGDQGKGNGPAATGLQTRITDLTTLAKSHNGVFPASYVNAVISGKVELPSHKTATGMPNWEKVLSGVDQRSQVTVMRRIHNLTDYIEQMQVK